MQSYVTRVSYLGPLSNLVNVSLLKALEEEEVELAVFGSSLVGRLLDEVDELFLGHVLGVAAQVVLEDRRWFNKISSLLMSDYSYLAHPNYRGISIQPSLNNNLL